MFNKTLTKCHTLAEQHRRAKGWQPGSLVAKTAGKGDEANLYIYQFIGQDFWTGEGVTADSVRLALESVKSAKTLNVYINSEGGEVFEAFAIYTQLKRFPGVKNVFIDGLCASAATLIAVAGDRIVTSEVGTWMIHEPWGGAMGNASDMREYADRLDMMSETLAGLYATQTGKSVEECLKLMAAETWLNASQALELGLTDEVIGAADQAEEVDAKAFKPAAAANATQRVLSSTAAEVLAFRARRSGAAIAAAEIESKASKNPARASPAKSASPASR
jgi:ATP-dependent Clp protease protease subunit